MASMPAFVKAKMTLNYLTCIDSSVLLISFNFTSYFSHTRLIMFSAGKQ